MLSNLQYELSEGGSVTVKGTISYNGEELENNDLFGELSGLAAEGEISIKLLAPAELVQAKKGYRAGKPDTPPPPADGGSGKLDLDGDDDGPEEQTPESAFADSVLADQQ